MHINPESASLKLELLTGLTRKFGWFITEFPLLYAKMVAFLCVSQKLLVNAISTSLDHGTGRIFERKFTI